MSTEFAAGRRRGSFLQALIVQGRVIGALILRELHTRYGRENVGYLWMIGEPMMLASVIGVLHAASGGHGTASDIKPMPFSILGYTVFILFRGIVNRSEGMLEGNAPLLYHQMVTVLDISLARAFLEFCGIFLTFVVLMALTIGLGYSNPPERPLYLIAAWAAMFFYSLGQGLIVTALSYENRTFGRFVHPYSYFMTGLSGAFFQLSWIPHPYREWLEWIPMTSIFELARYGQFYSAKLTYFYGEYLFGACLILNAAGLFLVHSMRHKIHLS